MTTDTDPYAPDPKASQRVARASRLRQPEATDAADADPGLYQIGASVIGVLAVLGIFALAFSQFSASGPIKIAPTTAPTRAVFAPPVLPSATIAPDPTIIPATPTAIPLGLPVSAPVSYEEPAVQQADWTQPEIAPLETGEKEAPARTTQRATAIARGQLPPPAR